MKAKIIINVKKLISVLLCTVLISSALPNTLLNGMVFAAGGNNNPISVKSDITFAKPSKEDKILEVKSEIKNYTITKIVNTSIGNRILKPGQDYEFNSNKITLKNKYLLPFKPGKYKLEIHFLNSDTKEQYKVTTTLHMAIFDNLQKSYTISDRINEAHRGNHSDPRIYDGVKIHLNCGDSIKDEIKYESSNRDVATIGKKTGDFKLVEPGKFKAHATRKFKKPKDKNYTTLQFESGFIPILTPEEFINGGSSNKNDSTPSPIKLKKGKPVESSKIKNSTSPDILTENKNNIESLNGTPTFPNINTSKNIPTFSLDGNNNHKNIPTKKKITKTAPRKMIAQPITDENDRNIKIADILRNFQDKMENNNKDVLSKKFRQWNKTADDEKKETAKKRIAKWIENRMKIANARADWNKFAHGLLSNEQKNIMDILRRSREEKKAKKIQAVFRGFEARKKLDAEKRKIAQENWKEETNKLKSAQIKSDIKEILGNIKKNQRQELLKKFHGKIEKNNRDVISNKLRQWNKTANDEKKETAKKRITKWIENRMKIANARADWNKFAHGLLSNEQKNIMDILRRSREEKKAKKIQAVFRGFEARKKLDAEKRKIAQENWKEETNKLKSAQIKSDIKEILRSAKKGKKAEKIQAAFRGFEARKKFDAEKRKIANVGKNIPINSTEFSLKGKDANKYYIKQQPSNIYGNIISKSNYRENNFTFNSNSDFNNIKLNKLKPTNAPNHIKNRLNSINPPNNFQLNVNYNFNNSDNSTQSDGDETKTDDDLDEIFEAEDSATGIQVYAPKGVFPKSSKLVVKEMQQNTDEYDNTYKNLDDEKKNKIEHIKLYEVCVVNKNNEIIQPNISKGLITVKIPTPNDHDLTNLQIDKIKQNANDNFNENIVNINNRNYCEFQTNHFSPYTMIDEKNINDIIQTILPYLVVFAVILLISLSTIILKKRNTKK